MKSQQLVSECIGSEVQENNLMPNIDLDIRRRESVADASLPEQRLGIDAGIREARGGKMGEYGSGTREFGQNSLFEIRIHGRIPGAAIASRTEVICA
jgi:hypothetical protein